MPTSPNKAPVYALYRDAVAAVDVVANVPAGSGINMANYEYAHIQVVPSTLANPTVAVYWWSELGGVWVQEHTPISKAGVGVNTPYEFTVPCRGRIMLVAVSVLAAGTVSIAVAGESIVNAG
jgi:hypothetical protein